MNRCKGEHKKLERFLPCAFLVSGKWVTICGGCYNGSRYKNADDFAKRLSR